MGDVIGVTLGTLEGALGRGRGSSVTSSNPISAGVLHLHLVDYGCRVWVIGILRMLSKVSFASPLLAHFIRVMLRCVLFGGELMGDEDTFPE